MFSFRFYPFHRLTKIPPVFQGSIHTHPRHRSSQRHKTQYILWVVLFKGGSIPRNGTVFLFVFFSLGQGPKLSLLWSSSRARHRAAERAPKYNRNITSLLLAAVISLSAGLIITWENKCGLVFQSFQLWKEMFK